MRRFLIAVTLSGFLLASSAFGQIKHPGTMPMMKKDSSGQMMNTPEKGQSSEMDMDAGQGCRMSGHDGQDMREWWYGHHMMWPMMGKEQMMDRPFLHLMMVPALFLMMCMLLMAIDMTNAKRFNGLWIPVLLLMGIPGTALYALFRIGDNIKAASGQTEK